MQDTTTTQSIELFKTALVGNNFSPRTVRAYGDDALQFCRWLATESVRWETPNTITKIDIAKFLSYLAKQGATGKTRFRKVIAIKKFFAFMKDNGIIQNNPTETIIPPMKERRDIVWLRKNEYKALLFEASQNPRDFAIIQTFLQTGIRLSELTNLTLDDLDLTNSTLLIQQGKGKKDRTIDLPKEATDALRNYLKVRGVGDDQALFLSRNNRGMYHTTIRLTVHKYLKKAGVKKGAVHTLRHTFGTIKAMKGVPPKILQAILGHKRMESTLGYMHLAETEIKQYQVSTPL